MRYAPQRSVPRGENTQHCKYTAQKSGSSSKSFRGTRPSHGMSKNQNFIWGDTYPRLGGIAPIPAPARAPARASPPKPGDEHLDVRGSIFLNVGHDDWSGRNLIELGGPLTPIAVTKQPAGRCSTPPWPWCKVRPDGAPKALSSTPLLAV